MKKVMLIIFICFGYCTIVLSQSFNIRTHFDYFSSFFCNLTIENDTISIIGYVSVDDPYLKVKLNISKFLLNGTIVENHVLFPEDLRNYLLWYQGATSKNEQNTLIVGSGDEMSFNNQPYSVLLDNRDSILWKYNFERLDGSLSSINTASILLEDNSSYNVIVDRATPFNYQARIAHLDGEGELVWEKFYTDTNYYYSPFSIIMDADSNLIVGLTKASYYFSSVEPSIHSAIWKVDRDGEIIDEFLDTTLTKDPNRIIQIENNDLIYIDKRIVDYEDDGDPLLKSRINRLGNELEKVWSVELGKSFLKTELHNLIQTNDGNFIAVGRSSNYDIDPICSCGHVVKFREDGEVLWESYIGKSIPNASNTLFTQNVFYDIKELETGGFIAVGESRVENDTFPQQGWIVRMDEMGQVTHTFAIPQYDNHAISIYPNPASNFVRLASEHLALQDVRVQVFSMQGTMVMDTQYSEDKLDISGLASGLYSVVIDGKYVVQLVKKE